MSLKQEHIRHGFGAVRPYLYGKLDLPEFVMHTFDAVELERHQMGNRGFHIEAKIGDAVVVLETGDFPVSVTPTYASVMVYVEDVDGTYRRALEWGATSLDEPEDKPYGERTAGVRDTSGNTWWITSYTGAAL